MSEEVKTKKRVWIFYLIVTSAALMFLGILLGSFVWGTIYLASIGSILFMVGIILYIVSELRKM